MKRSLAMATAAAAVACVAAGTPLFAQGSSVDQQSGCMSGRVGAGVAMPCEDGSAVFFSPAGLAMQRSAIGIGVSLINSSNTFRYDPGQSLSDVRIEREAETIPVPQAFINYRASDRLAVGIGAFAPYGLGLKWEVCDVQTANTAACAADPSSNFEGRFTGYDNAFRGVYIQPTVAYQLIPNRLSVGAGFDYVLGSIEVNQRADLAGTGVDIADANLKGDGKGSTFHVSGLAKVTDRVSLGVRYLHSAEVDLEGDATFTRISTGNATADAAITPQFAEGGALASQGIGTTIEFPWQFVAGVNVAATDRLNLMADYQRTGWKTFDQFDIDFENESAATRVLALNYRDANTFRFAADFAATDALALRAGFRYNTAASPRATPFLPESERNYFSAGAGYRFTRSLGLDLAYQYINQPDRRGAVRPNAGLVGVYGASGQIFGLTLSYQFGRDRSAGMQ